MSQTAKIFLNGRSQAVRLPAAFRFDTDEVFIRRDPVTGDVILSRKPESWEGFLSLMQEVEIPDDFLGERERNHAEAVNRDPLAGMEE
jgi:antitoxin VapB